MDNEFYLAKFLQSADRLDKRAFDQTGLALKAGVWLNSVVLKIQKPSWLNRSVFSRPFQESIFFSIWVSNESIKANKLLYNIHALKLRELQAYKIQSREFAAAFRTRFKAYETGWPNVSVAFGPITLMQGWVKLDNENL